MAARTIGELVVKMPEYLLPDLIPALTRASEHHDPSMRQGACLGLTQVVRSARKHVQSLLKDLLPVVETCICADSSIVQRAAAELFIALNRAAGGRVMDAILPKLVNDILQGSAAARVGLKQLMLARGSVILAYMLPMLLEGGVLPLAKVLAVGLFVFSSSSSADFAWYIGFTASSSISYGRKCGG